MKTQFLPLQQAADRLAQPGDRGRAMAVAVGVAFACAALLPTSPVESVPEFYSQSVRQQIQDGLAAFNENVVFDLARAEEAARQVWLTRYRAAHPPEHFAVLSQCGFFETLFGVPATVAPDDVAFYDAAKGPILHMAGVASDIIRGLRING